MKRKRIETSTGMWVRTNRQRLGWSQHRLAANIDLPEGIHSGRIAEIENGQRPLRSEWRKQMEIIFAQGKDPKYSIEQSPEPVCDRTHHT